MQPFRFSLDRLMKYREIQVSQIFVRFLQAQSQLSLEQQALEEITLEIQHCRDGKAIGTVAGYFQLGLFWEDLIHRQQDQRGKVQEVSKQLDEMREELATAKQRSQVLENLRDRYQQEYNVEMERELQNQGDELVMLRYQQRG